MSSNRGKYTAAFLLPPGAEKSLDEEGWNFRTHSSLSETIIAELCGAFSLRTVSSASDMQSYEADGIQVLAFLEAQKIDHIYLKMYKGTHHAIALTREIAARNGVELFVPSEDRADS